MRHVVHNPDEEERVIGGAAKRGKQNESIGGLVSGSEEPGQATRGRPPRAPQTGAAEEIKRKEVVPRATELAQLAPRQEKNYLRDNRRSAAEAPEPRGGSLGRAEEGVHKNYGKVPKYINQYNQVRADAEERKRTEEALAKECPPGTCLMPEAQRVETLEQLRQSRAEINTVLERMPIAVKSQAMQRKQKELEDKLVEIDKAITTFSKDKVYIAIDA